MEEMTQSIDAATSPTVQIWMNWMVVIFILSIVFVWKHTAARMTFSAFVLSAILGMVIFKITGNPHLLGISHILIWTPLAVYILRTVFTSKTFQVRSPFGIWVTLLLVTIAISLVFDVRDIAMVSLGTK